MHRCAHDACKCNRWWETIRLNERRIEETTEQWNDRADGADTALKAGAAFAVLLCTNILDSVVRVAACAALIKCIAGGARIDGASVESRLRCLCRLSSSGALAPFNHPAVKTQDRAWHLQPARLKKMPILNTLNPSYYSIEQQNFFRSTFMWQVELCHNAHVYECKI